MKKLLSLMLVLSLIFSLALVGCNNQSNQGDEEKSKITIVTPDGAPTLAVYQLMHSVTELDGHKVEYKIVSDAQAVSAAILSGEADVAVMPTNVAAKLYNNGVDIKLLSVNVFGVLYMIGAEALASPQELKGKVVALTGQSGTPDITLRFILDRNNIEYVESETAVEGKVALRYFSGGPDVIAQLKTGKADYGVLGEPAVTGALNKTGGQIVMNLQKAWEDYVGDDTFTQAGIVVKSTVYNDNGLIEALNEKLTSNLTYVYENASTIKDTFAKYESAITVNFNSTILNRCNLNHKTASQIKTQLELYYQAILGYAPAFIGGKLPDEGFYLI